MIVRSIVFVLILALSFSISARDKLIGGDAPKVKWGYNQTALFVFESGGCSAVKIGRTTFLTAAHCFYDQKTGERKVGSFENGLVRISHKKSPKGTYDDWTTTHFRLVKPHPLFNTMIKVVVAQYGKGNITAAFAPDVAIFQVRNDTPKIKVAPIDFSPVKEKKRATLTGWGCEESADIPNLKIGRFKKARTKIVSESEIKTEDVYELDKDMVLSYNFFTYGKNRYDKASLCPGDSGGPVFVKKGFKKYLVGINAFYSFDKDHQEPGKYVSHFNWHTRLAPLKDWILETLK